jgi:murein DD-endopeptidase MepM/ murein hydrolase activator NlpD
MKKNERSNKWGVYAPKDGLVVSALTTPSSYGNRIYIRYQDGYTTLQAHNSMLLVNVNDKVKKGQLIAFMGDTGDYPAPNRHGHLGLIPPNRPLKNLKENCINPVPWLVNGGCYPYNTKVTFGFQHDYSTYFHEGIDFSGLEENLIKGWEKGIEANTQRYYK